MSNTAISIIFGISGLLCAAWMIVTIIQSTKQRKGMERDIYLKELEKVARQNERELEEAERMEKSGEQPD